MPAPLVGAPPPALARHLDRLDRTNQALGRLEGLSGLLPDRRLFL